MYIPVSLDTILAMSHHGNILFGKRDDLTPADEIQPIACFTNDCLPVSADWLTSVPNGIVGYILGIILVVVGIWRTDRQWRHCTLKYPLVLNVIAMLELFFSMALRCSLGRSAGNKPAMYRAALFTGYHAPVVLTLMLAVLWRHIYLNHKSSSSKEVELSRTVKRVTALVVAVMFFVVPTALAALSAAFAMSTSLQYATALGALLATGIIAMAVSSLVALSRNTIATPVATRFKILMSLVVALLLLWSSFTVARANVSLANAARSSQVLYYFFAYAPSRLIGVILKDIMVTTQQGKPTPAYSKLQQVYCLDDDCSTHTDWLLFQPSAIPLWIIGAMLLTLSLVATIRYRRGEGFRIEFTGSKLTSMTLALAMMLRAPVAQLSGSLMAEYAASIFFNYHAGLLAYFSLCTGIIQIVTQFQPPTFVEKRVVCIASFAARFVPFLFIIIGVALMFHPPSGATASAAGVHFIQASLVIVMLVTTAITISFFVRLPSMRGHMDRRTIVSTVGSMLLVLLWTLFMFARTFAGLDSVARTSDVVFWMLNYLPLIVQCLVAMSLGEPLYERQSAISWRNGAYQFSRPEQESADSKHVDSKEEAKLETKEPPREFNHYPI
ncbi:hypothetical protein EV175_000251 [Coemansia sp. RSA 1933]|nr:hypothetical protein EV175_000251 [Coemansia sp. RSA 1933]